MSGRERQLRGERQKDEFKRYGRVRKEEGIQDEGECVKVGGEGEVRVVDKLKSSKVIIESHPL